MRTLKLTHEQIEILQSALNRAYNQQLKIITDNARVISEQTKAEILKTANEFDDLYSLISEGGLDA